jgi:hypothetical protein
MLPVQCGAATSTLSSSAYTLADAPPLGSRNEISPNDSDRAHARACANHVSATSVAKSARGGLSGALLCGRRGAARSIDRLTENVSGAQPRDRELAGLVRDADTAAREAEELDLLRALLDYALPKAHAGGLTR